MNKVMVIQGLKLTPDDIKFIKKLIANNPTWNRTQISKQICKQWNWYTPYGQMKDMACRTLLLKLEKLGFISLPSSQNSDINFYRTQSIQYVLHQTNPISADLKELSPIKIETVNTPNQISLFKTFLSLYHYLGFSTTVGENMKYIVFDKHETPLACLLFGSAAWKVENRDKFIGWDTQTRKRNLYLITNNHRFLVLPWVSVKCLASHILGKIAKRINDDWISKYNHPILMLETFVEQRFAGICYKASNWIPVGSTKGRTRNDRYNCIKAPIKDIYLYPINKNYKKELLCY